ncbi:MAG: imidazole glycerol phosphate synthase subunit HisH [Deltaproteobacteria bacterium]|jgi:glutamine amidotransferase|nr:imidazole glycerol phosphate synthase subunit HisH [Deltaproteobacteria bacterium]MDO8957085.1 imidazole glycerol phosphate synthase subunit HisH [Deltaproteobacteria bacterium]MDO9210164.1 imidazole glycerol phosphate synthase subunit HisH [Deltaproteobacteria bacterium]
MIVIVDYGMGNLRSVHKALERVGFQASVTQDPAEVKKAAGLIVPGVGAFKKAMENLQELGLVNPIIEFVESGKPFLGICLGLQLLFSGSDEFGFQKGLSLFKGRVVRFPFSHPAASPPKDLLKVPHMGWNTVHIHKRPPVLDGIADGAYFYFVHSYYPVPEEQEIVATTTDYGGEFVSSVSRGNLFACQFHPEKSQSVGLKLLKNFGRLVNR